jgi:hypothetical protein
MNDQAGFEGEQQVGTFKQELRQLLEPEIDETKFRFRVLPSQANENCMYVSIRARQDGDPSSAADQCVGFLSANGVRIVRFPELIAPSETVFCVCK